MCIKPPQSVPHPFERHDRDIAAARMVRPFPEEYFILSQKTWSSLRAVGPSLRAGSWARSEIIGYAICPSYMWFRVSGFRCQ